MRLTEIILVILGIVGVIVGWTLGARTLIGKLFIIISILVILAITLLAVFYPPKVR